MNPIVHTRGGVEAGVKTRRETHKDLALANLRDSLRVPLVFWCVLHSFLCSNSLDKESRGPCGLAGPRNLLTFEVSVYKTRIINSKIKKVTDP